MLGRLHAVVGRRRGRIIQEELREGEDVFDVSAVIPVLESFCLYDDIRKSTSGHALQPQLRFTHWEVQEFDPNGEPGEDDDQEREDWLRTIRLINVSFLLSLLKILHTLKSNAFLYSAECASSKRSLRSSATC